MEIYTYLKKDHKKVKQLFTEMMDSLSDASKRQEFFLQIKKELTLHSDPEQETFYKELNKGKKGKEEAKHGKEEEKEMFKLAKKVISKTKAQTLVDEMEAKKEKILTKYND